MNNEIQIFGFDGNDVRVIDQDGEPWFILKDICAIFHIDNDRTIADRLEYYEKNTVALNDNTSDPYKNIISVSAIYSIISYLDAPNVSKFKKWLTLEVLPSIYRTEVDFVSSFGTLRQLVTSIKEQEKRISFIESCINTLEAKQTASSQEYFTIEEYACLIKRPISVSSIINLSRKAIQLSNDNGYIIELTTNSKFPVCNIFHIDILRLVFHR